MKDISISIIIPTYKPKSYLWDCLDSLKQQTTPHINYEIIVVLNGEREPYYSLIQTYIEKNFGSSYNVYLLYSDFGSVSNARNIGLDYAKGEFITFIDDDDYVSASYLEELYKSANKNTISLSHPVAFNETGVISNYSLEKGYIKVKDKDSISYRKARRFFQGPCMKLFHRDIIRDRRFDPSFKNGEDSLFMFLISDAFKYVKAVSEEAIYYRRIREDGAAYSKKPRTYLIKNATRLISKYCGIYFSNPFKYNFSFFFTRIMGALRMCLN